MYKEYFGFRELPFSIAPDPRYLYLSAQHQEALAHLTYGITSDGGFVMLTGEVGTGKTTVCRCLLEQIPPGTRIAFIINPKITVPELLASICDEFGIRYPEGTGSVKVFTDLITRHLLEACADGSRAVLIIDEAQKLEPEVLEQLRLLTNLETSQEKLLRIILLGQPELRTMLARPELRQLNQRITARCHLGPLRRDEVEAYVSHRLQVAGSRSRLFPPFTVKKLCRLSGGIPRVINVLCDRALIGAYVQEQNLVTRSTLAKAAREVFGEEAGRTWLSRALPWVAAGLLTAGVVVFFAPPLHRADRAADQEPQADQSSVTAPGPMVSPSPATPPAPGETPRWLFAQAAKEGEQRAWQTLFTLWGMNTRPGDAAFSCRQAQEAGLLCYASRGSLADLRRFNRPAVLKLFDDQSRECFAVLAGLGNGTATVMAGGETRELPLIWFGEYTLLWRPPPGYRGQISPGDRGPVIPWLEKQLALVRRGTYRPRDTQVYDKILMAEVKAFQRDEGLTVDGVVGPQTLIRLTAPAGDGAPILVSAGGG